jgi:hypothetical protein
MGRQVVVQCPAARANLHARPIRDKRPHFLTAGDGLLLQIRGAMFSFLGTARPGSAGRRSWNLSSRNALYDPGSSGVEFPSFLILVREQVHAAGACKRKM